MNCEKCGNELFLDRKSVADLDVIGCVGGRFYCVTGCTSIWLKKTKHEPFNLNIVDGDTLEETRKKRYYAAREPRFVNCKYRTCNILFQTRGNNVKYCLLHGPIMKRKRDREWFRKKRLKTLAE